MEDVFLSIMQRIKSKMPELSLIDEDYGQLETDEDTYPVTFPCVLIGHIDVDWTDIGIGVQKGQAVLMFKLAIDCYHDTHSGSGTEDNVVERLKQNKALYKSLQGFRSQKEMSALKRIKSRDYSIRGGIKVYETMFGFHYHDNSAVIQNP